MNMLRVLWSSLPNTDSHDSEAFYMLTPWSFGHEPPTPPPHIIDKLKLQPMVCCWLLEKVELSTDGQPIEAVIEIMCTELK
eukprot:scaffold685_cov191-Alexandrium_tamarense.AAC.9